LETAELKVHLERDEYQWKKCGLRRKILTERPDVINWRCSYLLNKTKKYIEKMGVMWFTQMKRQSVRISHLVSVGKTTISAVPQQQSVRQTVYSDPHQLQERFS
jgi:hypothetical protein